MQRLIPFVSAAFLAITVMLAVPTGAAADGAGAIKYRQAIMKAVGGHMGAVAAIVKGKGGEDANLGDHTKALATLAKISLTAFPEESDMMAGKTEALDKIWEEPEEFAKVSEAFVTLSAALAEAGASGDKAAAGKALGALGKGACKACHSAFREK